MKLSSLFEQYRPPYRSELVVTMCTMLCQAVRSAGRISDAEISIMAEGVELLDQTRRKLDKIMERLDQAQEMREAGIVRWGVKQYGDGETWTLWWVFPASVSDEEALERAPIRPVTPLSAYTPTGWVFHKEPTIQRSKSRVLVRQYGGWQVPQAVH